jgi:hypothetical protein
MGMGKNVLAEKIQEEVTHYIRAIQQHQGEPVDLTALTKVSVSSNVCSIVLGQRFEYDDHEFKQYLDAVDIGVKLTNGEYTFEFQFLNQ